eukprot:TRINITY_DN21206_c0_g1_i1.p1 TRINITY_DN21206_c0_g1~~TRINITY_DN21206_c0_g1_i1.p1  ORF type:complete len:184 (+),score=43.65 TRINITY_DN21206_c0_g1_i1:44-553(+)
MVSEAVGAPAATAPLDESAAVYPAPTEHAAAAPVQSSESLRDCVQKWEKEGTPLRYGIKAAREQLNGALIQTASLKERAAERWDEISSTALAHTSMTLNRIGMDVDVSSFKELCVKHPGLVTATTAGVVMLPSLLFGKRVALRNGITAAAITSAGTYTAGHWQRMKQQR